MQESYALALWGWAARWLAHIWVVSYIEKNNIKINEISGTSMGAIIASCYALWFNSEKIIQIAKDINYLKLVDLGSREWIIRWNKIHTKLKEFFENKNIEDCDIPLKIVATDLSTGEKTIFQSWPIADAVRASISLPSIIKPFLKNDREYIDWWISSNLPIEVLENQNIIAVSALKNINTAIVREKDFYFFSLQKSFFAMNYQILQKSIIIMMKQNELSSLATPNKNIILLEPDYGKLDFIHFHKVDEFIEVWEKIAEKKLKWIL